ncbi:hypothetical protein PIB30_090685 [Stylosanthes scabra]|uniref:Phytocyanin domain-containing protein n=1 Tax=Stylosanthes scabra TaxID=79078 RepID=A0ABU6ZT21_9FABA|nr:hypothetical protein [Stylosanthes scabra]
MEFVRALPILLVLFLFVVSTTQAFKFNVGGSAGWVPNPSQSYNQWAGRNRFQINDTLVFKYKKGSDSVLEVKKEDYEKCNKSNPIKKFTDGNTEFTFDHSGPFYFISGQDDNCKNKAQKLIVVVLAPRGTTPTPPKSPSPAPSSGSPPVPAPTPAPTPAGNSPAPSVSPPSPTPPTSPAPAGKSPSPSPSSAPVSGPPAPTPAGTTPSPSAGSPGPATAPPPPTTATPPGAASPSGTNETAPAPGKQGNKASASSPSKFLVYSVTIVVAAVFFA